MVKFKKKTLSILLSLLMAVSLVFGNGSIVFAQNKTSPALSTQNNSTQVSKQVLKSAQNEYGLADNVQDGTILHAWNWYFKDVTNNIQKIADAGYSAVQVSPIQKEKSNQGLPHTSSWWALYQPENFKIGNVLGTRDDFKTMCQAAHQHGVKIIVDVVANHMANNKQSQNDSNWSRWPLIDPAILNNENFWHMANGDVTDDSRYDMTQKSIGEPDLNTSNKDLQNIILSFLNDAQSCGADGFRFDAAKHIELPTDPGCGSDFWPTIINGIKAKNPNVYAYGEVLQPFGTASSNYTKYMSITASNFGNNIRNAGWNFNAQTAKDIYFSIDASPNKLVTWTENHDTYTQDGSSSSRSTDDQRLMLEWGLIAGRSGTAPLFFVRPADGMNGDIGGTGDPLWYNKQVVEANKFHNAMIGQNENLKVSGQALIVDRGHTGTLITNLGDGTNLYCDTELSDGSYIDHVSGRTFTASNGKLSGYLDGKSIAAIYNENTVVSPAATASPGIADGTVSFNDSETVTLSMNSDTEYATYSINDGTAETFNNGQEITIGADAQKGEKIKLTLTAVNGTVKKSVNYYYQKSDQQIKPGTALIELPSGWNTPNIYVYDGNGKELSKWPGEPMTAVPEAGNNVYGFTLPDGWTNAKVIFNDGTNQIPGKMQTGFQINNTQIKIYRNGSWQDYNKPAISNGTALFKLPSGWGAPNIYVYDDNGKELSKWPGESMTAMSGVGDNVYDFTLPDGWTNANVIFNDGINQIPGKMQAGLPMTNTEIKIYEDGNWQDYSN